MFEWESFKKKIFKFRDSKFLQKKVGDSCWAGTEGENEAIVHQIPSCKKTKDIDDVDDDDDDNNDDDDYYGDDDGDDDADEISWFWFWGEERCLKIRQLSTKFLLAKRHWW